MDPSQQPHHSERLVFAVVLIGLISFSAGVGVGYALNSYISALNRALNRGQSTILVQGSVSSPKENLCCYYPDYVNFVTSGLAAYRVEVHIFHGCQNYTADYSVYLPIDTTYYVYLGFLNYTANPSTGQATITECVPIPSYIVVSHFTGGTSWVEFFNFRC